MGGDGGSGGVPSGVVGGRCVCKKETRVCAGQNVLWSECVSVHTEILRTVFTLWLLGEPGGGCMRSCWVISQLRANRQLPLNKKPVWRAFLGPSGSRSWRSAFRGCSCGGGRQDASLQVREAGCALPGSRATEPVPGSRKGESQDSGEGVSSEPAFAHGPHSAGPGPSRPHPSRLSRGPREDAVLWGGRARTSPPDARTARPSPGGTGPGRTRQAGARRVRERAGGSRRVRGERGRKRTPTEPGTLRVP